MSELSSRHHALIQALLSRGPLNKEDFEKIFEGVTGKNPGGHRQLFNDYLLKINKQLSYVQFELRACRNQYDGGVFYGVVNNVCDEQSKLGTKYSVPQIAFYKGIIEAIVQDSSGKGCITNIDALNIQLENQTGTASQSQDAPLSVPAAFRNFSMSQKDKTLAELVKDQWLCSTPDGNIGLGVRSFLDLRSWFRSNDIASCEVCNEAGVKAELCQNEGCTVRIHQYCLKKKFSQRRAEKVCPSCGTQWPYEAAKSEAVEEEDEPCEAVQSQQPPSGSSRKKRKAGRVDAVRSNPSQPSSRKASRVAFADAIRSNPSQPSSQPNTRRVTRSSAHPR